MKKFTIGGAILEQVHEGHILALWHSDTLYLRFKAKNTNESLMANLLTRDSRELTFMYLN